MYTFIFFNSFTQQKISHVAFKGVPNIKFLYLGKSNKNIWTQRCKKWLKIENLRRSAILNTRIVPSIKWTFATSLALEHIMLQWNPSCFMFPTLEDVQYSTTEDSTPGTPLSLLSSHVHCPRTQRSHLSDDSAVFNVRLAVLSRKYASSCLPTCMFASARRHIAIWLDNCCFQSDRFLDQQWGWKFLRIV